MAWFVKLYTAVEAQPAKSGPFLTQQDATAFATAAIGTGKFVRAELVQETGIGPT